MQKINRKAIYFQSVLKGLYRIFVFITDINECRLDSCLCGNCADLINDYYLFSRDYGYNG